jgi:transcriptional regulator with XRE-family HTH domain
MIRPMKLGQLLAAYRKANGLTLDELARETGVNRVALWRLEQGKFECFKQWPAILRWVFGK